MTGRMIVGVVVIAVVVALVAGLVVRNRLRARRARGRWRQQRVQEQAARVRDLATLRTLLPQARAGNERIVWELEDIRGQHHWPTVATSSSDEALITEYHAAIREGKIVIDAAGVLSLHDRLVEAIGTADRLEVARELLHYFVNRVRFAEETGQRAGITLDEVRRMVNGLLVDLMGELAAAARSGDRTAFLAADHLYNDTHDQGRKYQSEYPYYKLNITAPARPAGWNELVHLHLRNPYRWQFDLPDLSANDVAHMAADAELGQDVLLAKIVVACGADPRVRDEVGVILWTKMLRMIARHHAAATALVADEADLA